MFNKFNWSSWDKIGKLHFIALSQYIITNIDVLNTMRIYYINVIWEQWSWEKKYSQVVWAGPSGSLNKICTDVFRVRQLGIYLNNILK